MEAVYIVATIGVIVLVVWFLEALNVFDRWTKNDCNHNCNQGRSCDCHRRDSE